MASLIKDKLSSHSPRSSLDGSGPSDPEAEQYRLLVTAGPSYDPSTHRIVHVNTAQPTVVSNRFLTASIKVRIRNYRGLPSHSPSTSAYFSDPLHSKDQYSIAFSFTPKEDLPSVDTVWGNDFDHPVRERLPPGFNTAFKIVKEWIDPGLECDAYADEPWLYGPSLSCWFAFGVGDKHEGDTKEGLDAEETAEEDDVLHEGADSDDGWRIRRDLGIPESGDKRRKHFLSAANREAFTFEANRTYHGDFYNPYLDFGNFALKLPGFSIRVIKYIDDKSHKLRYVFKNRRTGDVYFCVVLNLLWGEELKRAMRDEEGAVGRLAPAQDGAEGVGGEDGTGERAGTNGEATGDGENGERDAESTERVEPPATSEQPAASAESVPEPTPASAPPVHDATPPDQHDEIEPGLRDKPPELVEEIKKTSIQDMLRGSASVQQSGGKTGALDDDVD